MNIALETSINQEITGNQFQFKDDQHHGGRTNNVFQVLITNLEPSVSISEWRRIFIAHFQALTSNSFQVSVQRQTEGSCCATVKLSTLEDAQLAIVQLNRRKIGYRRIHVTMVGGIDTGERHKRKPLMTSIGLGQQPRFHHQRFMRMRESGDQKQPYSRRNDRSLMMNPTRVPQQIHHKHTANEVIPNLEDPLCIKHRPGDPRECMQLVSQPFTPSVYISLSELRPNVIQLLQDHNNQISIASFTHCYEATFGPLDKIDTVPSTLAKQEMKNGEDAARLKNRRNYVCLEHLLTCVPNVNIQTTADGIRVVVLAPEAQKDSSLENTVGQSNGRPMHASSSFGNQESRLDDFPGVLSQDYLRQLRREVVELVKQQPGSALPLAKFIPAFHAQFGKQCCVADYGYSRLQDLIDALKGIVHTVGEGPLRMIMLTHVIQVRRFTHDILRLLKSEPKKSVPIGQLPRIYEQAFHKEFIPSNYGVCEIMDLMDDISDTKLAVEDSSSTPDGPAIVIPRRIQTAEQKARTKLFAIEVIDMLSMAQRFQIAFTKFIPAYHHNFNRQCRVSEYGFSKFIELLEALPKVVEVREEKGEKCIILTNRLRLAILKEMLLDILESQPSRHLPLTELVPAFLTQYQLILLPQDYGFSTLEELVNSFAEVQLLLTTSPTEQQPSTTATTAASEGGDGPKTEVESGESSAKDQPQQDRSAAMPTNLTAAIFVCLVDRSPIKVMAHRCLQLLFNSPYGSMADVEISERFRTIFQEEIDVDIVKNEMAPFIIVKDYSASSDEDAAPSGASRVLHLCPLILFARQLRFLLLRSRGRLMLNMLETIYRRHFGVPIRPENYGYPSLQTLVNAASFVAVVRGRGARAILLLAQDDLGKLAWSIAYKVPFRHHLLSSSPSEELILAYPTPQDFSPMMSMGGGGKEYLPLPCDYYQNSSATFIYQPNTYLFPPGMTVDGQQVLATSAPVVMDPCQAATPIAPQLTAFDYSMPTAIPAYTPGFYAPSPGYIIPGTPTANAGFVYGIAASPADILYAASFPPSICDASVQAKQHHLVPAAFPTAWQPTTAAFDTAQPPAPTPLSFNPIQAKIASPQGQLTYGYVTPYCLNQPMTPMILEASKPAENSVMEAAGTHEATSAPRIANEKSETVVTEQQEHPHLAKESPLPDEVESVATQPTSYLTYQPNALTSWFPQPGGQIWGPGVICQGSTAPMAFGGLLESQPTPQQSHEALMVRQHWGGFKLTPEWPILPATSCPTQPNTIDPIFEQHIASDIRTVISMPADVAVHQPTFSQTPRRPITAEGIDQGSTPLVNRCEEGDWTLPISMTTESIDANLKENDETGSLG